MELIRRLAEHQTDRQIAGILGRQGRKTGTGLPFTEARVRGVRRRVGIPAAPPPDPAGELLTIEQAISELGVSTHTIRRWIDTGLLLPAEQTTPGAPWQIRLTDEIRARLVPTSPTATCRSPTPRGSSGAPAGPCCTRSNAASSKRSTSPTASERA